MNRETLENSIFLKNLILNDVMFNLRMQRKGNSEIVNFTLLKYDLNYLDEWLNELELDHDNREAITLSNNASGKYVTTIVEADSESYDRDYIAQFGLLSGFRKICQQLINGEIKSKAQEEVTEAEVDSIMNGIYERTGIENPNKKEETGNNEKKETNSEELIDDIMNDIYKKIDEEDKKVSTLEVILNEAYDTISDMNKILSTHDDHLDEIIEWSKNSVSVFEKLKSDLERDYKNGDKISLAFLKPGGGYEVKMVDNDAVYFEKQMKLFDSMISASKELEGRLTVSNEKDNSETDIQNSHEVEDNQDKKIVVFRIGNDVCIVGNGIEVSDAQNLNSNLLRDAFINGYSVKLYNCPKQGLYGIHGIKVRVGEDGVMTIDGSVNEIEFHNHPELAVDIAEEDKKIQDDNSNSSVLDELFNIINAEEYNLTKKSENVCAFLEKHNPDIIWGEVLKRLENGTMTLDECHKFDEYLLTAIYDNDLKSNYFLKSKIRTQLVEKYSLLKKEAENDKTNELMSGDKVLDKLIELVKKDDKEKIAQLIGSCRSDELCKEIMKRLEEKSLDEETYQLLLNKLSESLDDDYKQILFNYLSFKKMLEKYPLKKKDNEKAEVDKDAEKVRSPKPVVPSKRRVKSRKDKKSLVQRFKELKKWQKVAIVAGAVIGGAALIGVGVYHFVPGAAAVINNFISGGGNAVNPDNVSHVSSGMGNKLNEFMNQAKDAIQNATDKVAQVAQDTTNVAAQSSQPLPSTVDYSVVGQGHKIFSDAFSAVSGTNPLTANQWLNNNPLGVFNTATNQFLNVTPQQLHDVEFLKQLANDPNNAMLFGKSLNEADGFIPLVDLVGEVIKGGKVL